MLEEDEKLLVEDFIGQHWQRFLDYAGEMGYTEEDAEEIYKKLGKK